MATTWGEAEVDIHIDGTSLPREVREVTREAAAVGGKQFQSRFNKYMRAAGKSGAKEFASSLGDLFSKMITTSGAFQKLRRSMNLVRRDFKVLSDSASMLAKLTFNNLSNSVKKFGTTLKEASDKNLAPFREGMQAMIPTMEDWQATFPRTTRAIQGTTTAFRNFGNSLKEMGAEIRSDQVKTMGELREGFRSIKPSLDDLKATFPGVTKVVQNSRTAFARVSNQVKRFGTTIRELGPDMESLQPSVEKVSSSWDKLGNRFKNLRILSKETKDGMLDLRVAMENLRIDTEGLGEANKNTASAINSTSKSLDRSTASHGRNRKSTRSLLSSWKRLPHGFRQVIFWIGLTIAAMGTLSVLSSALAGTILALVTVLSGLAAGTTIAIFGFQGLFAEGAKLTEGAQASKKAFEDLGTAFKGVRDTITNNMFEGMASSIEKITNELLPALEGNIANFATIVGDSLGRIFDALASPEGIENFQKLLDGFGPIFASMVDGIISFGDALADILIASLPFAQSIADGFKDIAGRFAEWTEANPGRLEEFFNTAATIMPKVVDLVAALADALSGLVTPETIAGAGQFIDALTDFMPVLGEIVAIVANLNVFGVLAAALNAVGAVVLPLIEPLKELASIVGTALIDGFSRLEEPLTKLGVALAPVIDFFVQLISAILPPLIDIVVMVVDAIAEMASVWTSSLSEEEEATTSFMDVVKVVFEAVANIIGAALDFTVGMFKLVAALLKGDFSGAFQIMYDTVSNILDNFGIDIKDVIKWFEDLLRNTQRIFDSISKAIGDAVREIGNFFRDLWKPIQDAIGWFSSLFGAANNAKSASSNAGGGRGAVANAAGSIVRRTTHIMAGEAGPEAIVPLRRPLNRVNPEVRALSAIAQGLTPGMASGGVVGGGKTLNVQPGAIVINGVRDPNAAAVGVVNRLAERIAS